MTEKRRITYDFRDISIVVDTTFTGLSVLVASRRRGEDIDSPVFSDWATIAFTDLNAGDTWRLVGEVHLIGDVVMSKARMDAYHIILMSSGPMFELLGDSANCYASALLKARDGDQAVRVLTSMIPVLGNINHLAVRLCSAIGETDHASETQIRPTTLHQEPVAVPRSA